MPYIKPEAREKFRESILTDLNGFLTSENPVAFFHIFILDLRTNRQQEFANHGEYNYVISAVLWGFLEKKNPGYELRSKLIGVLESVDRTSPLRGVFSDVVQETYRRYTAKYEDQKMAENGDIWTDGELV